MTDTCPRCDNPYRVTQSTTFGGQINHDDADQARTCFTLVPDGDGEIRLHLYYHARADLLDEADREGDIELTPDHGGGV